MFFRNSQKQFQDNFQKNSKQFKKDSQEVSQKNQTTFWYVLKTLFDEFKHEKLLRNLRSTNCVHELGWQLQWLLIVKTFFYILTQNQNSFWNSQLNQLKCF